MLRVLPYGDTGECDRVGSGAQALHPSEHAELQARLQEGQARGRIERALDALSAALAARGLASDLSGRPKNLWGVFGKMAAKGYGLESVYDVRGLRVIVSSKADCYEALRQVLFTSSWRSWASQSVCDPAVARKRPQASCSRRWLVARRCGRCALQCCEVWQQDYVCLCFSVQ